jgi:hypothetical protein
MIVMERKKFEINIIIPLLLFIIALAGCSGVKTEMDRTTNISTFKTYSWKAPDIKNDDSLYNNAMIDNTIKENIESELAQKGLSRKDQNPDIYVQYHTYTRTTQAPGAVCAYMPAYTSPLYGPVGYAGYNYCYSAPYLYNGYAFGFGYPAPYFYTQETLIIDLIDAKTNKVVWRGSVDRELSDVTHIDKVFAKEVHAIMKKYSENTEGKMVKHHL